MRTARQFAKETMGHIRSLTSTLPDEEYDAWLEELQLAIEDERERLKWRAPPEAD